MDHAVSSHERIGIGISSQSVEQLLELGTKSVSTQGGYGQQVPHIVLQISEHDINLASATHPISDWCCLEGFMDATRIVVADVERDRRTRVFNKSPIQLALCDFDFSRRKRPPTEAALLLGLELYDDARAFPDLNRLPVK